MCLETIQKCLLCKGLFDTEKTGNVGKNPKAVQKPSGKGEFSASMIWSHPKWLQMSGFNELLTFLLSKRPPKWCVYVLRLWSSSYFFPKLKLRSPKKIKQKKNIFSFFFFFCTLFAKNEIFATRVPFVNRQLLLNGRFWTGVCYV